MGNDEHMLKKARRFVHITLSTKVHDPSFTREVFGQLHIYQNIYIYITFLDRSYYSFASGHLKSPKKLKFHAVAMTIYLSHQTVTASVWRLCPILIRDRSLRL